jgi:hypothetical protein
MIRWLGIKKEGNSPYTDALSKVIDRATFTVHLSSVWDRLRSLGVETR